MSILGSGIQDVVDDVHAIKGDQVSPLAGAGPAFLQQQVAQRYAPQAGRADRLGANIPGGS
jgi:hypothetical protein